MQATIESARAARPRREGPARLSARLEAVLSELGPCELLADVCADHAQLARAAVARGLARHALALELRAAPMLEARRRLRESGLGQRVSLVRSDGFALLRRVDLLVIAGVGGNLAAQLLARSPDTAHATRVVAQPNRHSRELRCWARGAGFHLASERAVAEGALLHLVLTFVRRPGADPAYGRAPLDAELELGPLLLASGEAGALEHLRREHRRLRALAPHRPDLAPALLVLESRTAPS